MRGKRDVLVDLVTVAVLTVFVLLIDNKVLFLCVYDYSERAPRLSLSILRRSIPKSPTEALPHKDRQKMRRLTRYDALSG